MADETGARSGFNQRWNAYSGQELLDLAGWG